MVVLVETVVLVKGTINRQYLEVVVRLVEQVLEQVALVALVEVLEMLVAQAVLELTETPVMVLQVVLVERRVLT